MLVLTPILDLVPSRGFDLVDYVLNKSSPKLGIGPGPMYNIGPGPMCHMGLDTIGKFATRCGPAQPQLV